MIILMISKRSFTFTDAFITALHPPVIPTTNTTNGTATLLTFGLITAKKTDTLSRRLSDLVKYNLYVDSPVRRSDLIPATGFLDNVRRLNTT